VVDRLLLLMHGLGRGDVAGIRVSIAGVAHAAAGGLAGVHNQSSTDILSPFLPYLELPLACIFPYFELPLADITPILSCPCQVFPPILSCPWQECNGGKAGQKPILCRILPAFLPYFELPLAGISPYFELPLAGM
jgi:hypothetical protein